MTEHEFEIAKAKVLVKNGKVEVLTSPKTKYCPLLLRYFAEDKITKQIVKKMSERQINELGMYTENRIFKYPKDAISFGASEMLMDSLKEGIIDCAVVVCDGAGTVIVTDGDIAQGIGIHMPGIIRTSPIKIVQEILESKGSVVVDKNASINQLKGLELAIREGYRNIAVTITGNQDEIAKEIRKLERELNDGKLNVIILAVHTTGITKKESNILLENADIVWGCASKYVRKIIGKKALLQIGVSIPVFALTKKGKEVVLVRALHFEDSLLIHREELPVVPKDRQPCPLS